MFTIMLYTLYDNNNNTGLNNNALLFVHTINSVTTRFACTMQDVRIIMCISKCLEIGPKSTYRCRGGGCVCYRIPGNYKYG